jgi:hypothetical protein
MSLALLLLLVPLEPAEQRSFQGRFQYSPFRNDVFGRQPFPSRHITINNGTLLPTITRLKLSFR